MAKSCPSYSSIPSEVPDFSTHTQSLTTDHIHDDSNREESNSQGRGKLPGPPPCTPPEDGGTNGNTLTLSGSIPAISFSSLLLPMELLQTIFRHCCHPDSPLETGAKRTLNHPVFSIMQVCSAWRQIALDTPELWSNVRAINDDRSVALATRWFSRAGNTLRSLSLSTSRGSIIRLQQLISRYPLRSLDITFGNGNGMVQFSDIPVESLLPLVVLRLKAKRGTTTLTGLSLSTHTLPNLEVLFLSEYVPMPQFHRPNPFATWHNLRELHVHCALSQPECIALLRNAPNVESCTLRLKTHLLLLLAHLQQLVGAELDPGAQSQQPAASVHQQLGLDDPTIWALDRVNVPNLKSLALRFGSGHDAGPFIDLLALPNLNSLTLCNKTPSQLLECDESTFERLVERSARMRNLEKVVIPPTTKCLHIAPLLGCMKSLRHLNVFTSSEIDIVTAQDISNGDLGPRLEVLHVGSFQDFDRVLSMIESRQMTASDQPNVSRLKKASFRASRLISASSKEHYQKRVDELRRSRVNVTVGWS